MTCIAGLLLSFPQPCSTERGYPTSRHPFSRGFASGKPVCPKSWTERCPMLSRSVKASPCGWQEFENCCGGAARATCSCGSQRLPQVVATLGEQAYERGEASLSPRPCWL